MVTMRSSIGMKLEQTLSSVVFPVPVPPLIMMFARARTQARRKAAEASVRVPNRIRSPTWYGSLANLRMVRMGPSIEIGGTTALTREPSRRRASQRGWRWSMRRPTAETIRSMTRSRWFSSSKRTSVRRIFPSRSTYTMSVPLTMISVRVSSSTSGRSGPRASR